MQSDALIPKSRAFGDSLSSAGGGDGLQYLGEVYGWGYGFGAAGVGMVMGLIQFRLSRGLLGSACLQRGNDRPLNVAERYGMTGVIAALGWEKLPARAGDSKWTIPETTLENLAAFIDGLDISAETKARLRALRPETYTGLAGMLARK